MFRSLALVFALTFVTFVQSITVSDTVLCIARDAEAAKTCTVPLNGYAIPVEVLLVPQNGIALPVLNSTAQAGNYGAIVIVSEVSYQMATGFLSALTAAQFETMYQYQRNFGVRMVRLDAYPSAEFGTTTAISGAGCCNTGVEQLFSFTDMTAFPTAGLKAGATVSTKNLWHYPATITNATTTKQIAKFAPGGSYTTDTVAAVINTEGNRKQMVFFTSFGVTWNKESLYIQHAWIHWVTRGLYAGFRRLYFSTQVDDVFLGTELYDRPTTTFRCRPDDLKAHVAWQKTLNTRLTTGNPGSLYFAELAHNGNGVIEAAVEKDTAGTVCIPNESILYDEQIDTPLEFQKPLGSGTNIWPATPTKYSWTPACEKLDPLLQWFQVKANLDAFAHMSHTFSHASLNNATSSDCIKEIQFNKDWMKQTGIDQASKFSPNGLVPPAITGLHNGDAIKAWMDNGIKYVVGDNTRPVLRNSENTCWPYTTNVGSDGYAGLIVMPRWATTIYYNCDTAACTTSEWINTSGGSGTFADLLLNARDVNVHHLLGLAQDPYMFHQANLRVTDIPATTINGVLARRSLLMSWVETITNELIRLVNWPIITLKHDDIAVKFINRQKRDLCKPKLTYNYSADNTKITGVTLTATGNTCSVPIPVTFPGPVTNNNGGTVEKVGNDPLTLWVTLSGAAKSFTLSTPISL